MRALSPLVVAEFAPNVVALLPFFLLSAFGLKAVVMALTIVKVKAPQILAGRHEVCTVTTKHPKLTSDGNHTVSAPTTRTGTSRLDCGPSLSSYYKRQTQNRDLA